MTMKRWAWGAAAVGAYVGIALALAAGGARLTPLFDGQAPPEAYRWVEPPPEFEAENQPPTSGEQTIKLRPTVDALSVGTDDAQAFISAPANSFVPAENQRTIRATVNPLDPTTLGPPPPELVFEGNAYEVEAVYETSGEPAALTGPATVVLRYPVHASDILRWTGERWQRLPDPVNVRGTLTIYAQTREFGTFVAARPPEEEPSDVWLWVSLGAGVVAAIGAALFARHRAMARATPTTGAKKGTAKSPRR